MMNPLAMRTIDRLRACCQTVAVAESCTGGMIGAALTAVPGSSDAFRGGVIAYDNGIKRDILGVPQDVLDNAGAVSGECVRAMAQGVRRLIGADYSVSVSGIAGPGGGTPEKPVGLVWIGIDSAAGSFSHECRFSGDRESIRIQTVQRALELLAESCGLPN